MKKSSSIPLTKEFLILKICLKFIYIYVVFDKVYINNNCSNDLMEKEKFYIEGWNDISKIFQI